MACVAISGTNLRCPRSLSTQQLLFEVLDHLPDVGIHFHAVLDQPAGMKDGAVITPAERLADRVERAFSHVAGQEHGNLSRKGNVLRTTLAGHVRKTDVKVLSHAFLDQLDIDRMPA